MNRLLYLLIILCGLLPFSFQYRSSFVSVYVRESTCVPLCPCMFVQMHLSVGVFVHACWERQGKPEESLLTGSLVDLESAD